MRLTAHLERNSVSGFLGCDFNLENGGDTFLRNVGNHLQDTRRHRLQNLISQKVAEKRNIFHAQYTSSLKGALKSVLLLLFVFY
jgi:hypothetical protein